MDRARRASNMVGTEDAVVVALRELYEACEYVKPIAGAVAVKASVKQIRQAGNFIEAMSKAEKLLNQLDNRK